MVEIKDYTQESDLSNNLVHKESLLNDFEFVDEIQYDKQFEGTPTKKFIPGIYVPTGTNQGIQFGVDKATNIGFIQSVNYVADSAGWRADSTGSLFATTGRFINFNIATALVAGENITAGDSICLINDLYQKFEADSTAPLGDDATHEQESLQILPRQTVTSSSVVVRMSKTGAPVDNLTLEIQTASGGSPSGTAITNGTSNTVGGGTLTTSVANITFTFASAFTLTAGTTYWVVWKRSGAADAANYYNIRIYGTDYASFDGKVYDGTSWGAAFNKFVQFTLATGTPSITVWRTDADIEPLSELFGMSSETDTAGNTIALTLKGGVNTNQSGLTTGSYYYISATAGAIATTKGTYGNIIGLALSATSILILEPTRKFTAGTATLTKSGGGSAGSTITRISTPFRPVLIEVSYHARQNSTTFVYWSGKGTYDGANNVCIIAQLYTTTAFTPEVDTVLCRSYSNAAKTANNDVSASNFSESGFDLTLTSAAGAAGNGDFYISYVAYS